MGTLVLGIGNVLMGDEGVGVRAAQRLAEMPLGEDIAVLDGGTGGFHLLSHFDAAERLILIDAALDGFPAGTVRVLRPRFLSDFPRALSAHEIGLRDLLETATLLGKLPPTELVTVSVRPPLELGLTLSPAVAAAVPEVIARVRELLA
ncbi:MAG: hydrogenase maturation protease, partial [Thermoanaerobaculia bacterium]